MTTLFPNIPPADADRFEDFWQRYPLKKAKKAAHKAWLKAVKRSSFEEIVAGLGAYVGSKPDWQGWMHAATFLNGERWRDEVDGVMPASRHEQALRDRAAVAQKPWGKHRYSEPELQECVDAGLLTPEQKEAAL